jgi:hypothetical protein
MRLALAGLNLTRFYWNMANVKVEFFDIFLLKNGTNVFNASRIAGGIRTLDVFDLEFNTEFVNYL